MQIARFLAVQVHSQKAGRTASKAATLSSQLNKIRLNMSGGGDWDWGPIQWDPRWTSLNIARGRVAGTMYRLCCEQGFV